MDAMIKELPIAKCDLPFSDAVDQITVGSAVTVTFDDGTVGTGQVIDTAPMSAMFVVVEIDHATDAEGEAIAPASADWSADALNVWRIGAAA